MSRHDTTLPQTVPGLIEIVGDLSIFVRGDSNMDSRVDIADAVNTLGRSPGVDPTRDELGCGS
jgi:hypothetical protein